jgi:hypothetical protein
MKTFISLICLAFLLTACRTAPTAPVWLPEPGERVATNYCQDCPNQIGPARIVTVTGVKKHMIFAPEFPKTGLDVKWVAKWEGTVGTE